MTSTKDHGRYVLAAIFPNRFDLLDQLRGNVTEAYFQDEVQKNMLKFMEHYFDRSGGGILTKEALSDILGRLSFDAGRVALYEETFDDLLATKVEDTDFTWSLHELREDYAENNMKALLTSSMKITTTGLEQNSGEVLKGQEEAREYLLEGLANLDMEMRKDETPHGDMREEADDILAEYAKVREDRAAGKLAGIRFGISELDNSIGGLQSGELVLSAAYSSDGKTSLCIQLAWSAAIEQGKNVLILSTETAKPIMRRRLVARHSMHPKFIGYGLPEGLNSKNLKDGSLTDEEEALFQDIVHDLSNNPDYGTLYIHQVPRGASMDVVEQIMIAHQKKFHIDIVICDYLALLRPSGARSTDRESLSGILKNAKQITTTFNKGQGVTIVSPWQVSRDARDKAMQIGMYTRASLAETSEATNTPDVIVSLLAPEEKARKVDLVGQVLKHRDGETINGLQIAVDYATSTFTSKQGFASLASQQLLTPNLTESASILSGADSYLPQF